MQEGSFCPSFKWAWKGSRKQLLTPIASNKNGQLFDRNLMVIKGATNAQLPK
jgi:hypothetical protein